MSVKAIVPRERAHRDIAGIVDYYATEAGAEIALRFIDALQAGFIRIGTHPASGSLRYAYELDLPELRHVQLSRYPYLIFYIDREDHIDVWRVLHAGRDIPGWLIETEVTGDNSQ